VREASACDRPAGVLAAVSSRRSRLLCRSTAQEPRRNGRCRYLTVDSPTTNGGLGRCWIPGTLQPSAAQGCVPVTLVCPLRVCVAFLAAVIPIGPGAASYGFIGSEIGVDTGVEHPAGTRDRVQRTSQLRPAIPLTFKDICSVFPGEVQSSCGAG
jgi:hypothetical protein